MKFTYSQEQVQEIINSLNAMVFSGVGNAKLLLNVITILNQAEREGIVEDDKKTV